MPAAIVPIPDLLDNDARASASPAHAAKVVAPTPATAFDTKEGQLIVSMTRQSHFVGLMQATGLAGLLSDARFADEARRRANIQALRDGLQEALRDKSADEWERILNEAGTPAAKVVSVPNMDRSRHRNLLLKLPPPKS